MGCLDLVMQISERVDTLVPRCSRINNKKFRCRNLLFGEDREMHKKRDKRRTKESNRKHLSAEIGEGEVCPTSDYTGSVFVLPKIR